jgi:DMSO/TMAO reductase YedYZ molybdopterin-dependent catalytic subunit
MGVAAAAGYGGWKWLRSQPLEAGVASPFRAALQTNEKIAEAYFSDAHRSPEFDPSKVGAERTNGKIGLGDAFEPGSWVLNVRSSEGQDPAHVTMEQIRALPRVEQITQLNCIEGWTVVVKWAGARFADFTEKFAPHSRGTKYVSMETPDQTYYVGLDSGSALHPQTLLCYEMNGADLAAPHGAPLRLVIPVKYGVKNIKRIGSITYTNNRPEDYWANDGYDWYAGL